MKKFIVIIVLLGVFAGALYYRSDVIRFLIDNISNIKKEPTKLKNNIFASKNNFEYVKLTDNFKVKNIQDIKNVYYTVFNSGMTTFTFYCASSYENCIEDVNYISNNQKLLSHINNFVPVFNTFKNVETKFDNLGKVTINTVLTYNDEGIANVVNNKVDISIDVNPIRI